MAIDFVREDWKGRDTGKSQDGNTTYTEVYIVRTTAKTDDGLTILQAVDPNTAVAIPTRFTSTFSGDSRAYCVDVRAVQMDEDWLMWRVIAKYSYDTFQQDQDANPTARDDKVRFSTTKFQRPMFEDPISGEPIVNSAGDTFLDPPLADDSRLVITVTRFVSSVPSWVFDYQDTLNNASVTIKGLVFPAKSLKFDSIDVGDGESIVSGYIVFPVTMTIHYSPQGWLFKPLDQGFHYLDKTVSPYVKKHVQVKDKIGIFRNTSQPVALDGTGSIVDPNDLPGAATYLEFNLYNQTDWSTLNLPSS